jgi:hypothetical protein
VPASKGSIALCERQVSLELPVACASPANAVGDEPTNRIGSRNHDGAVDRATRCREYRRGANHRRSRRNANVGIDIGLISAHSSYFLFGVTLISFLVYNLDINRCLIAASGRHRGLKMTETDSSASERTDRFVRPKRDQMIAAEAIS